MVSRRSEWDPFAPDALEDQRSAYDDPRGRCPVAHSDLLGWSVLRESVDGRPLTEAEIVSIVRNWTVGELGTIAASVGIVVAYLAHHSDVEARLRADRSAIPAAIEEILRIDAPLIANRRVTARPATLAGLPLPTSARVTVLWASAKPRRLRVR